MTSYAEKFLADFRLTILEILSGAGVETNLTILRSAIEEVSMHRPSMDQLAAEVVWLADRGLLHKYSIGAALSGATITTRGEDAAYGRARVGGVAPGGRINEPPPAG